MNRPLGTLLMVGMAMAGCASEPPAETPRTSFVVSLATPLPGGTTTTVTGIGRLSANNEASRGFTSAGVIAVIDADIGDRVRKGQVLARLDSTVLDAEAREAAEQVARASRDLARLDELSRRQLVARQQRDDSRTGLDIAKARLRAGSTPFPRTV